MLEAKAFPSGQLGANTVVFYDKDTKDTMIMDSGAENKQLLKYLKDNNLKVKYITTTHAHFDHVFGTGYLQALYPEIPVTCYKLDVQNWQANAIFAPMFGVSMPSNFPRQPTETFDDGAIFTLGSHEIKFIYTPGHTIGGVCFYCAEEKLAVTGDTLFNGGVGRTDFPTGNPSELKKSIDRIGNEFGSDWIFYPGHGEAGTIGSAVKQAKRMV
eukprot:EST41699.1 Hydroxyacylglutathione hydrolase [Spironucleus salmonicida]